VRADEAKFQSPWTDDSRELAAQLKLGSVGLINDLEAYAYGIDALESKDFVTLSEGTDDAEGNRVVIAARTAWELLACIGTDIGTILFPCEGGHADFAPKNDLELNWRIICAKIRSRELRENSFGPGIKNITIFFATPEKRRARVAAESK